MSLEQCTVSSGLIIPDNIPGDDLKPYQLEQAASSLRSAGASAVTQAEAAETSWSGLPAVLESPQGPTIYAALGTPSTTARTVESKFGRVADALDEFAAAVRPIKRTFSAIKTDAVAFRATIRADERVWVSPRETKEYEANGLAVVSSTSYSTSYSTGSSQSDVLSYLRGRGETARAWGGQVQILAHWTESSEHVDKNNALMDRLADAYTLLQNAEADCANAINRQRNMCLVDVEYIEAWQLKQSGEDTAMLPWGHRVDEDRNCGESFWWGVGSAGGEMLEGLGTLIGRDPLSGKFSWEMAGQGWLGAVQGIGSLVVLVSPPLYFLGMAGVPVLKEGANMGNEMIKGLLAWDTWSENPSEAFGRVVFNVGTMFIPGAGQVGAAIKGLTAGARVLDAAADASRFSTAVLNGVAKLDNLVVKIDGLIGDAATTVRTTIDDLVPSGWKGNGPDGAALHVGGKTPDVTPPPAALLDGPGGPATRPDAPPLRAGGDDTPPIRTGDDAPPVRPGAGSDGPGAPGGAHPPAAGGPGTYRLSDGTDYTPSTGRPHLGPDAEPVLTEAAMRHGLTMSDLHHLIYERPVQTLTHAEARVLLEIREAVPIPGAGTLMQKVLGEQDMHNLINRAYNPATDELGGFLGRAGDGSKLQTAADYYRGYGLDYVPKNGAPNPFLAADGSVADLYAVRFELPKGVDLEIPNQHLANQAGNNFPTHKPSYHHPDGMDAPGGTNPYLGNGFVGKGGVEVIPEYHVPSRFEIGDGAEVWRIGTDGTETLVAVRINNAWKSP